MSLYQFPRKIYFQRDIFDSISEILSNEGLKNILLITDRNIFRKWESRIRKSIGDIKWDVFSDVLPEPKIQYIEKTAERFSGNDYDGIIAMGGGSVIDFAKSIAIKLSDPSSDLAVINPFTPLNLKVKLIAVPTTSGTGSDVSFGVVLSDSSGKLALGNYDLVPYIDILDPSLTPEDKAIILPTGIDAFVHSFESIASNTSTSLTDALAEKAIEIIRGNLKRAMDSDEDAKDAMHLAATMAGMAFSNSGTALAHALGHSFGATFHVTHGTSVGLFLMPSMRFNNKDEATANKYKKLAGRLGFDSFDLLLEDISMFFKGVGQPTKVRDLNIDKETYSGKINQMVYLALRDSELAFNPVIAGEDDIKLIFEGNY
ncbi:MAG: iron-containing alcohol dehydrogenase family protein [Thermoplasmatales archaeon]